MRLSVVRPRLVPSIDFSFCNAASSSAIIQRRPSSQVYDRCRVSDDASQEAEKLMKMTDNLVLSAVQIRLGGDAQQAQGQGPVCQKINRDRARRKWMSLARVQWRCSQKSARRGNPQRRLSHSLAPHRRRRDCKDETTLSAACHYVKGFVHQQS